MTAERGIITFECIWQRTPPLSPSAELTELIEWRDRLAARGLVGVDANGIGFGNVSVRNRRSPSQFFVSGSQTGQVDSMTNAHVACVTDFDVAENRVACRGPVRASSESMTHGVVYRLLGGVGAVMHVHHHGLWQSHLHRLPTTRSTVEAGTPEMAIEIEQIVSQVSEQESGVVVMGGHHGGLIAFGSDSASCGMTLLQLLDGSAIGGVHTRGHN